LTGEHSRPSLAVTTSGKPDDRTIALARQSAVAWGLPFLERRRKAPLRPILDQADSLLVFERNEVVLCDRGGRLRFSPGMARLRIKRLEAQVREDRLVELAGFEPGDSVLDCTLGLAADALVAARAVGPTGSVVGLEKSLAVFAVVSSGVRSFEAPQSCRIDVRHGDAADFLACQPDKGFDLVLFDPMFDRPRKCSPAFEMLRRYAEHAPLSPLVLENAQRVARRSVLVKGSRHSMDWNRLHLKPEPGSPYSPIVWARLPAR
jgi:16S rRNA (guanine1516-N2)-methyltransferase